MLSFQRTMRLLAVVLLIVNKSFGYEPLFDSNTLVNSPYECLAKQKILVFPEDGKKKIVQTIATAKKSLKIMAYNISDPDIIRAINTKAKSIPVTIILSNNRYSHEMTEGNANRINLNNKVQVKTNPQHLNQMHAKIMIIDDRVAFVGTGNWDSESLVGSNLLHSSGARDFAVMVTNQNIVSLLKDIFDADFYNKRKHFNHQQIVVAPDNQRTKLLELIASAKHSIHIYQQSIQDRGIVKALIRAIQDGVKVKVLMQPYPFNKKFDYNVEHQKLLTQSGAEIYLSNKYYIHAKVMVIDQATNNRKMYIGSCNFYSPSIDEGREIGIIVNDRDSVAKIIQTFANDLENSNRFIIQQ